MARFAARRLGEPFDALRPQLIGHLSLGSAVAAYDRWLADDRADLADLLAEAFQSWRLNPAAGR